MRPVTRTIAFTGMLLAAAGCYRGPGVDSPFPPQRWPRGIVVLPSVATEQPTNLDGVYIAQRGDLSCCWTSGDVRFQVRVPRDTPRTAQLHIVMNLPPTNPYLRDHPMTVRVAFAGGRASVFPRLPVGEHVLVVPLAGRGALRDVTMHSDVAFVPRKLRVNGDGRKLSFRVSRAYLQ